MSADIKTNPNRQRYEYALASGAEARRNGVRLGDNPHRGSTKLSQDLRDEWARGWEGEDAKRKGVRS